MTWALLTPSPLDTVPRQALEAVADMIATVLEPYGVSQSVMGPAEEIDVSPESGPFVESITAHFTVTRDGQCGALYTGTLIEHFYIAPIAADRLTAVGTALDLQVPTMRMHMKNFEFIVAGTPIQCDISFGGVGSHTRGEGETAKKYWGQDITCTLSFYVQEPPATSLIGP